MKRLYKPAEILSSDYNTPTNFYRKGEGGFYPGQSSEPEHVFFCMSDMYQSSIKDYEALNSTNIEYAITLKIPHPGIDYVPKKGDTFKVDELMYKHLSFDIETIAPDGPRELKIVGVSHVK